MQKFAKYLLEHYKLVISPNMMKGNIEAIKNANFLNKMGNISGSSCALLRSGKVAQEYGHQRSDWVDEVRS